MRGTEKYAHETQLSKRVGAWQEKLEPLMERQARGKRRSSVFTGLVVDVVDVHVVAPHLDDRSDQSAAPSLPYSSMANTPVLLLVSISITAPTLGTHTRIDIKI